MSMRDISEELRQSDCPAPPQPEGQPGFSPIALLLVVGDEPASTPPRAALSDQIPAARPHGTSATGCYAITSAQFPFSRTSRAAGSALFTCSTSGSSNPLA